MYCNLSIFVMIIRDAVAWVMSLGYLDDPPASDQAASCLFWTVNGRGKWPLRAIAANGRSAYIGKLVNFAGLVWVPRRV